jgi:hypothetical protein
MIIKIMETNENLKFIVNNQRGMDLLHKNYILKYARPNKDGSHYYKCHHYILNGKTKIPCPGSATFHDGIMLRFNSDHT